jgi:serine/threonine-protein kinase ATR
MANWLNAFGWLLKKTVRALHLWMTEVIEAAFRRNLKYLTRQKIIAQNQESICYKCRKFSESHLYSSTTKLSSVGIRNKVAKDYAYDLQLSLSSCIKFLSPGNHNPYPLEPKISMQVLSLLCLSLCVNPKTNLFIRISKQVLCWIPWICKQVGRNHEAAWNWF